MKILKALRYLILSLVIIWGCMVLYFDASLIGYLIRGWSRLSSHLGTFISREGSWLVILKIHLIFLLLAAVFLLLSKSIRARKNTDSSETREPLE